MENYLEKQNAALLKALTARAEKEHDYLLSTILEQQKQILALSKEVTTLKQNVKLLNNQVMWLYKKVSK